MIQNVVAVANTCFDSALEIINHPSYPPARKASDKRRIDEAVRSIIDLEEQARIAIKQQRGRSAQTIKSLTPPYTGYWVKPIAFRLPFLWLVIFLFLTLISSLWRVAISVSFHIPPYDCIPGTIIVNGSTTVFPLMNIAAVEYHKLCPASIIKVNPGKLPNGTDLPVGSVDGLNQILKNTIDIATSDTFADTTLSELKEYPMFVVPFALVINSDVTRVEKPDLSSDQITSIYGGSVSTWSQLDATWNAENITLVSRPASSEIRTIFEEYVLGVPEAASGPPRLIDDSNATIANSICTTPGAIGYVPLYYYYDYSLHHNHCLRLVTIDHNDPQSAELIKKNIYKFWCLEHIYTKGPPKGLVQSFINFMYTSSIKSYINQYDKYGYLSTTDIPSDLLASH